MFQTISLYTLNIHNITHHLYLHKHGEKFLIFKKKFYSCTCLFQRWSHNPSLSTENMVLYFRWPCDGFRGGHATQVGSVSVNPRILCGGCEIETLSSSGRRDVWNFLIFVVVMKMSLKTKASCERRQNQDSCREVKSAP